MNHLLLRTGSVLALSAALLFSSSAVRAQNDGAGLYKSKCAACHGADGAGETSVGKSMKIHDLRSADVQKQTDAQLTEIVTNGKSPMPGYKGKLTDEQIKQVVVYLRELAKK